MTAALLLHRAEGATPDTVFRDAAFGPADPFAAGRGIACRGAGGMAAGRVRFAGELDVSGYPHTEMLVVVEGELSLRTAGAATLVLQQGHGAVIARGTPLRVHAPASARFVFCAAATPVAAQPGLTPLRAEANFKPSTPPAADVLLGPAPECRSDNVFTDEASRFRAGTWDSTAYHRIVRPHRLNEFMFLLAGRVRFARPDGSVLQAGAGDALFVPQGAPVGWESHARVAKFYVVQEVPA